MVVGPGAEDRDYLDRNTLGWPEFRERIEQYPPEKSARAGSDGLDPLPGFTPAAEVPDDALAARYPLSLISAASHHFSTPCSATTPERRRRAEPVQVVLHPDDAAACDLVEGQRVRVANDRGGFTASVRTGDWVRPGLAATTKGHWAKLTGGSTVNATVAERDADLGAGAVYHDNRVEVNALD